MYWGQTSQGAPSGRGRMTSKDGTDYRGDFASGLRHGYGELFFSKSDPFGRLRYIGQFENGQLSGVGNYSFKDGSTFEGKLTGTNMSGRGMFNWHAAYS